MYILIRVADYEGLPLMPDDVIVTDTDGRVKIFSSKDEAKQYSVINTIDTKIVEILL